MTLIERERRLPIRTSTVRQRLLEHSRTCLLSTRVLVFHHHPALSQKAVVHMQPLTVLPEMPKPVEEVSHRRLPAWLSRTLPKGNGNFFTHELLRSQNFWKRSARTPAAPIGRSAIPAARPRS